MISPGYQNAGSAPVGEMGPRLAPNLPDPYSLPPHVLKLAEAKASQSKRQGDAEIVMGAAAQGIGPEEFAQHREFGNLYNESIRLAEQSMSMADDEFAALLDRLDTLPNEDLPMYVKSAPDTADAVAAALGMILDPRNAAQYSGLPLGLRDQRDAADFQGRLDAYRVRAENTGRLREGLEKRLGMADYRRRQAQDAYFGTLKARDDANLAGNVQEEQTERTRIEQTGLTTRAEMTASQKAVANRNTLLGKVIPYATSPEERNKLVDWVANMREGDLDVNVGLSDAEILQRARTANVEAKTDTENAMREPRLKKLDADIAKVLGSIKLDEARKKNLEAKTARIPEEFRLRWANAMKRYTGSGGGGREGISALKDIKSIASARVRRAQARIKADAFDIEAVNEAAEAQHDLELVEAQIMALSKGAAGMGAPNPKIDTSGGAGALKPKPAKKPSTPKNPGWKVEIE